jgi:hypothetical protein
LIFEIEHELEIFLLEEQNIEAVLADSACTTRAMHETINVSATTLNHNVDVINVQATGGYIGGY